MGMQRLQVMMSSSSLASHWYLSGMVNNLEFCIQHDYQAWCFSKLIDKRISFKIPILSRLLTGVCVLEFLHASKYNGVLICRIPGSDWLYSHFFENNELLSHYFASLCSSVPLVFPSLFSWKRKASVFVARSFSLSCGSADRFAFKYKFLLFCEIGADDMLKAEFMAFLSYWMNHIMH